MEIISGLAMVYGERSCACVWLHLQKLICSQCRGGTDKPLKESGGGKMQRCGIWKHTKKNELRKIVGKKRQRMTPDGGGRE